MTTPAKEYRLESGETVTPYIASAIAEGFGGYEDADFHDQQTAWQYLHDTRLAYRLQGWYGRQAQHLIAEGVIHD